MNPGSTSKERSKAASVFRLLLTRDFGLLWVGETISQIGDSLNRVALLWFAYQTSHSTLRMSFVGVVQTLPPLLLGPVIGVYLDRLRKKPALIAVSLIRGVLVSSIPLLHAAHLLSLNLLYVLVLVLSLVGTVAGPALATAVPLLVAPADLTGANALIGGTATIGVLLGPSVAGVGISLLGISRVLYVDAASFVAFAACVALIRLPERGLAARVSLRIGELARDLRAGLVFLARQQMGILVLTLVAGFQNIGASAFVLATPSWMGPSTAYSVSAVAMDPMICCSRVTKSRFNNAGCGVSTVSPQRSAAKSLPGMAKTLVPGWVAFRCLIAASWYEGSDAGWVKLLAIVWPSKSDGLLATMSAPTTSAVTTPTRLRRRHNAVTALARSMARASRTTGVARSVERRARPAVVSVMKDFSQPPSRVGSA